MSIFRRDDDPRPHQAGGAAPPPSASAERRPGSAGAAAHGSTHIAPGTKITGQVSGTSDLVVDGDLEGKVQLETHVTIGAEGRVHGDINARTVRIGGRVVGNVHGIEKVEILPSGRLEGDVSAPRVVLAEGAFFKGKVEMTGTSVKPKDAQAREAGLQGAPRENGLAAAKKPPEASA